MLCAWPDPRMSDGGDSVLAGRMVGSKREEGENESGCSTGSHHVHLALKAAA